MIYSPDRTLKTPLRFLGVLAVALVFAAQLVADPASLTLENGQIRLEFDATGGALLEFSDLQNGHQFVNGLPGNDLWRIDLLDASGDPVIRPSEAGKFYAQVPEGEAQALELVWEGFDARNAPDMRVTATVTLPQGVSESQWTIRVENSTGLRLGSLHFPRISPISPQEREVFAMPVWMGERTEKAREIAGPGGRIEREYPGILSMQCMAFYQQDGPGMYLRCDDTAALVKGFAAFGEAGGDFGLEVRQVPENKADNTEGYTAPYRVIAGAFAGDWFTVAERYRTWALEQSWAKNCRLRNGGTAPWVTDTGLWVWNRGRSEGVLAPAAALEKQAGVPVSAFWHWWHGCAYDMGFPEYLPPREGAEAFEAAVRRAHDAGVHAIVYMNQRLWGMTTESWKTQDAERYAVKGQDGTVHPEVYNTFTKAPCASMCMGTPFWRNTYAAQAEGAVRLGVDGIYMDQACSSLACYDPTHGHPLGGGDYWMNGFRLLQADIRERCAPLRQVVLAGEGCGETWLPYLDLMLSLQVSLERYAAPGVWAPIPFFHAVYHGYGVFYGNYSSLTMPPYDEKWPGEFAPAEPLKLLDRKFSMQFRLEQARAFVWGQQPSLANFRPEHFDTRPEELAYVVGLAKLRQTAAKYFLEGQMLRPPAITPEEVTIDVSRLSIYAGQQGALKEYQRAYPAVLAAAWRAPDGDVAVVLANITEQAQGVIVPLDRERYSLPASAVIQRRSSAGPMVPEAVAEFPLDVEITVEASSAVLYTFEAAK